MHGRLYCLPRRQRGSIRPGTSRGSQPDEDPHYCLLLRRRRRPQSGAITAHYSTFDLVAGVVARGRADEPSRQEHLLSADIADRPARKLPGVSSRAVAQYQIAIVLEDLLVEAVKKMTLLPSSLAGAISSAEMDAMPQHSTLRGRSDLTGGNNIGFACLGTRRTSSRRSSGG